MTTVVLVLATGLAALLLGAVLWSIGRALRAESSNARLRRDGVPATGTVVDNVMTSTTQRRLVFSPVVEFLARSGQPVTGAAQQSAASSWPRGTTVQVAYDPTDPQRFVLATRPTDNRIVANVLLGVLVLAILIGTSVAMYQVWWQFRYDRGTSIIPTNSDG